jgi:murein DD-endopeptidase MepM/ murein hydrolase activator NlpD
MSLVDAKGLRPQDAHEAAQALESMMLRQVFKASGAFHGASGVAGSETRADMFVEAMADAVAKAGGIGLARQLEQTLNARPATAPSGLPGLAPLPAPAAEPPTTSLRAPVAGAVTSGFGARRDPFHGGHTHHHGIDVAAPEGAAVRAAAGGVVRQAGPRGGYGLAIEIEHPDGTTTLYAHCSQVSVKAGERVDEGAVLGAVGHTGRATGDHLHFELRAGGRAVDPTRALKAYRGRADMAE